MKREIVTINFPFSDLSGAKRRPALVLADWGGDDIMLCQITTKSNSDGLEVNLQASDFENGSLPVVSNIRPNKIFTAERKTILSVTGKISEAKFSEVANQIVKLIS